MTSQIFAAISSSSLSTRAREYISYSTEYVITIKRRQPCFFGVYVSLESTWKMTSKRAWKRFLLDLSNVVHFCIWFEPPLRIVLKCLNLRCNFWFQTGSFIVDFSWIIWSCVYFQNSIWHIWSGFCDTFSTKFAISSLFWDRFRKGALGMRNLTKEITQPMYLVGLSHCCWHGFF